MRSKNRQSVLKILFLWAFVLNACQPIFYPPSAARDCSKGYYHPTARLLRLQWLPDGQFLIVANRSGNVYRVSTTGESFGETDRIMQYVHDFKLSPDGKKIAVVTGNYSSGYPSFRVNIYDLESLKLLTMIPDALSVAWSPDGNTVALTILENPEKDPLRYSLFLNSLEGNGDSEWIIDENLGEIVLEEWNLERESLTFLFETRQKQRGLRVNVYSMDTESQIVVDESIMCQSYPTWSPVDENLIAFTGHAAENSNQWDLFLTDLSEQKTVNLTLSEGTDESQIDWSPNGQEIVYVGREFGGAPAYTNTTAILKVDIETLVSTRLTQAGNLETSFPQWSPDGQKIAYLVEVDNKISVYLIGPDGEELSEPIDLW